MLSKEYKENTVEAFGETNEDGTIKAEFVGILDKMDTEQKGQCIKEMETIYNKVCMSPVERFRDIKSRYKNGEMLTEEQWAHYAILSEDERPIYLHKCEEENRTDEYRHYILSTDEEGAEGIGVDFEFGDYNEETEQWEWY